MFFLVNSEDQKKENFLERVQKLPDPKKKVIFLVLFGLVVVASLFYWLPRFGSRLSELGNISGENLFLSQEEDLKPILDEGEEIGETWEALQKNKEVMERLDQAQSEEELMEILEELVEQGQLGGMEIEELRKELEAD